MRAELRPGGGISMFNRLAFFTLVCCTAGLTLADTVTPPPRPEAVNYLVVYDRLRSFRTLELAAMGQKEEATAQAVYDETTYQRNLILFKKNTIPEEELRIRDMRRQVSKLSIDRFDHEAKYGAAEVAAHELLLQALQGPSGDVALVFENFKRSWDEQCIARDFRLKEALARQSLADYRMKLSTPLRAVGAVSQQEYDLHFTEQLRANAEVKASKLLLAACREGEPDLLLIQKLAGGR